MEGMFKRLDVISYAVTDWQRAKKFYTETLSLPVANFFGDEVGWMELGDKDGTNLALTPWTGQGEMPTRGGAVAVFEVADAFKVIEELRRRGVRCDDPIGVPGMVTWANFYDPDGNRLQVAGPPPPAT